MSRGERVAGLETLAWAIGNAAAPSGHVGSFGMTAAAVHAPWTCSAKRLIVSIIFRSITKCAGS
jgi:hypothetical protein